MNNKTKIFLDLDKQIDLLISRGLIFNSSADIDKFKWYLQRYNYQNFVNGYNDFFMLNNDRKTNRYSKNINSQMIIDLFNFDRSLISLFIGSILNIERTFASFLCYELMNNYDHLKDGLILKLSDNELIDIFSQVNDHFEINDLKKSLLGYGENKKINSKYNDISDIPLWSLSCNWSFGNLNSIYSKLNLKLKKIISSKFIKKEQIYKNYTFDFFKVMLMLNNFRNLLCHGNVIYNFKFLFKELNNLNLKRFYKQLFNIDIKVIKIPELILLINLFDPHSKTSKLNELYLNKVNNFLSKLNDDNLIKQFKKILLIGEK